MNYIHLPQVAMNRTKAVAASRFPESTVCNVLLFWEDEQKYESLPSSSTYFPHGTNVRNALPKERVRLRDETVATVIAVSDDKNDILKLQQRLEKKLNKCSHIQIEEDSFRFLDRTSEAEGNGESFASSPASPVTSPPCSAAASASQPECNISTSVSPSDREIPTPVSVEAKLLRPLVQRSGRQEKLLTAILRELKRQRPKRSTDAQVLTQVDKDLEPVVFENQNLIECAPRNATPSLFGIEVARILWNDDELKNGRIGTCKRRRGRPALDIERQALWIKACETRFHHDCDMIDQAKAAVNQLGNDLKQDKRKRLP